MLSLLPPLQAFDFSSPSWDLFIILFFVVFSMLYGVSLGRDRILSIIIAIYMALAVVHTVPAFSGIAGEQLSVSVGSTFAFRVTLFLGTLLLIFFFLSRSALSWTLGGQDTGPLWQVVLYSILHVGLLISVTLSFLPTQTIGLFAPITRSLFLSETGRMVWVVLPIIAMVFARPRGS
jgi:hypothetical protein